jgi:ankyrin repeat protein
MNTIDEYDMIPIVYAAMKNELEIVKLLISAGSLPNLCASDDGITALMMAC